MQIVDLTDLTPGGRGPYGLAAAGPIREALLPRADLLVKPKSQFGRRDAAKQVLHLEDPAIASLSR